MAAQIKDRYAGFILLFIGIMSWFIIIPYGIQSNEAMTSVGPAFFPRFITIAVIVLSILLVVKSYVKSSDYESANENKEDTEEQSEPEGKVWVGVVVFAIMVGYIFLADLIGYLYSTIISMTVVMWLLGARKWYLYVILIVFIFAMQYVFENIMYIRLP